MKLTLQDLKEAMSPLSSIGKGELSFEVNGLTLILRALTPEEEIYVQRYARQALTEGEVADQTNALEYLDRFRICSLGYALVQVADLDFRNVEFIETGEKLPNGTAIKVRKHEAVIQLVQTWSRNMVNAVFKKFGELQNRVEKEVEGLIEFDEVDYDAEIARLEERIRELKETKAKSDLSTKDPRTDARNRVIKSPRTMASPVSDVEQEQQDTKTEHETLAVPSDMDREIEDLGSDGPSLLYEDDDDEDLVGEDPQPAPQPAPSAGARSSLFERVRGQVAPHSVQTAPSQPTASRQVEEEPHEAPFDGASDSFVDPQDPESMSQAIAEENRRLLANRSRSAVPHLAAKRVAEDLSSSQEGPKLAGQMGGMEVYKMPTQTMTDRKPSPNTPVANPPATSTKNPKFRPVR